MRVLIFSAAAFAVLAAGPALAGDPRGGGYPGDCCAPPPPPPPSVCCNHGGGRYVSIDVDARTRAFAETRRYDVARDRGWGGGAVHVAGGYGGYGYGYAGGPVYYNVDRRALACASAPFGYVVEGFGRDGRRPPSCGGRYVRDDYGYDRGGRYGYSERHDGYRQRSYEVYESYEEYGAWEGGYIRDRRDCDCREPAPYPPPYLPEPPRYEPPRPPRAQPPRPHRPRREAPRQQYRQEPGERG